MFTYPPKDILVAVDFGDASAHAVRIAGAMATRYGAHLVGLHAEMLDAPPYFTHDQIEALERQLQQARARASRYLSEFAARLTAAPVEPLIADGPAAEAVLAVARTRDLVVMGTHGRRGPSRWWLGSVAERVVRGSISPVLVVRAAEREAPGDLMFRRILVVDASDPVRDAGARYAHGLADAFGGSVVEELSTCGEDDVRRRAGSLLVVARAGQPGSFGEAAERLVRTCELPMLFVPEPEGTRDE